MSSDGIELRRLIVLYFLRHRRELDHAKERAAGTRTRMTELLWKYAHRFRPTSGRRAANCPRMSRPAQFRPDSREYRVDRTFGDPEELDPDLNGDDRASRAGRAAADLDLAPMSRRVTSRSLSRISIQSRPSSGLAAGWRYLSDNLRSMRAAPKGEGNRVNRKSNASR